MPPYTFDAFLLALCVWREARGQQLDGKRGVAWTVSNRVALQGYMGKTYAQAISHPWAYTSMTGTGDPNLIEWPQGASDLAWFDCLSAANEAIARTATSPVGNATHYYDDSIKAPSWTLAETSVFVVKIGRLNFWKVQ